MAEFGDGLHKRLMDSICDHVEFMAADTMADGGLPHPSGLKLWIERAGEVMAHYDGLGFPRCPLSMPVIRLARGLFGLACMPGGVTFNGKHYEFTQVVECKIGLEQTA